MCLCRRKLASKVEDCDNLLTECDRRNTLIAGLTADRDKAAAAAAAAQAKLRKLVRDEEASGPPKAAVDASMVGLQQTARAHALHFLQCMQHTNNLPIHVRLRVNVDRIIQVGDVSKSVTLVHHTLQHQHKHPPTHLHCHCCTPTCCSCRTTSSKSCSFRLTRMSWC